MQNYLLRVWSSLSLPGLVIGVLFFAVSLTPSLIPRPYMLQGVLSGCSLAAGYGLGVFGRWLWHYLELPALAPRLGRLIRVLAVAGCAGVAIVFLWQAARWQNSVRSLMGLDPVETAEPLKLALIALLVFIVLITLARLFRITFAFLSRKFEHVTPKPVARLLGIFLALALFWSVADGLLLKAGLRLADSSFRELDALIDSDLAPPENPLKTGSAGSLIPWQDLGFRGREFVTSGPTAEKIGAFLHQPALEPIRVYVGLNAAETAKDRAALALAELKRTGAFERSTLIVVVPTGTGWVDPAAMDTVEYLHHGDVASVALQYSYLTSWLSLLVEPSYGAEAGEALFKTVYGYWTTLPKDRRPKLYLHGLSLGALNSERSADLFDVIGDPFQGALWSGPPFASAGWKSATAGREPGSPAWLPRFRDSSVIRFTAQKNALDIPGASWGPMRIVYLQYASDPVTFFDPHSFYREPDWMKQPRGPDVSPYLRWYPVVTMLQLALDMAMATTSPMGYGHVYAPEHYVDAWMAVTDPQGLAPGDVERLKAMVSKRD
ncbi:alpha/beta hydrolase [Pararhizobium qamdonense]|uniref:alpha/beta hydrolase n=1 Tax=Pararhizobium qamdonense TaxID=3031126 RepID=UPI0023E33BC4|nr:alpha/beta-hydrolase family protein [Pararhizobium qamdonense]